METSVYKRDNYKNVRTVDSADLEIINLYGVGEGGGSGGEVELAYKQYQEDYTWQKQFNVSLSNAFSFASQQLARPFVYISRKDTCLAATTNGSGSVYVTVVQNCSTSPTKYTETSYYYSDLSSNSMIHLVPLTTAGNVPSTEYSTQLAAAMFALSSLGDGSYSVNFLCFLDALGNQISTSYNSTHIGYVTDPNQITVRTRRTGYYSSQSYSRLMFYIVNTCSTNATSYPTALVLAFVLTGTTSSIRAYTYTQSNSGEFFYPENQICGYVNGSATTILQSTVLKDAAPWTMTRMSSSPYYDGEIFRGSTYRGFFVQTSSQTTTPLSLDLSGQLQGRYIFPVGYSGAQFNAIHYFLSADQALTTYTYGAPLSTTVTQTTWTPTASFLRALNYPYREHFYIGEVSCLDRDGLVFIFNYSNNVLNPHDIVVGHSTLNNAMDFDDDGNLATLYAGTLATGADAYELVFTLRKYDITEATI